MICYFFNVYRCVSKMKLKYQIINIQNVYKIAEFLTEISYKINTFFFLIKGFCSFYSEYYIYNESVHLPIWILKGYLHQFYYYYYYVD